MHQAVMYVCMFVCVYAYMYVGWCDTQNTVRICAYFKSMRQICMYIYTHFVTSSAACFKLSWSKLVWVQVVMLWSSCKHLVSHAMSPMHNLTDSYCYSYSPGSFFFNLGSKSKGKIMPKFCFGAMSSLYSGPRMSACLTILPWLQGWTISAYSADKMKVIMKHQA